MPKKKTPSTGLIQNRRARHDYALEDNFVAGIQLTGAETKALRMKHGHLRGAYVTVKDGELWLLNATITDAPNIIVEDHSRSRKLLAKKKEIESLIAAKQQGRTIVPIELITKGRYIKVRIAAGKGKKNYDKRQVLKKRDEDRAMQSAIKFKQR